MIWNAENVFLSIVMNYTHARYQMLYQELDDLFLLENNIELYRQKLMDILDKQQILQR